MSVPPINPPWLAWPQTQALVTAFAASGDCLRFVGGAVRDALLGREVTDVDAATLLLPQQAMSLLEQAGIRVIPTGLAHGTVTAVVGGKSFEVTTLRKDVTTDGRHAEVAFTDDWRCDASRRDFTMNAMYFSPSGEIFDYFGGMEDARAGHVRFIGDANKRISEDFLRALRYFRFYAHYGIGEPDAQALAACRQQASYVSTLSGERVQRELAKLLQAPSPYLTLALMHSHQMFPHTLGFGLSQLAQVERLAQIVQLLGCELPTPVWLAAFVTSAAASHEDAHTKLVSRLKLSNHADRTIHVLLRYFGSIHPAMTLAAQKKMIRRLGNDDFLWAVLLAWAAGSEAVGEGHAYAPVLALTKEWSAPAFPVSGDDLIALGMKPGREMGEALARLEDAWEASDYTLGKDALLSGIEL